MYFAQMSVQPISTTCAGSSIFSTAMSDMCLPSPSNPPDPMVYHLSSFSPLKWPLGGFHKWWYTNSWMVYTGKFIHK